MLTNRDAYSILRDSERVLEEAFNAAENIDEQAQIDPLLEEIREEKKAIIKRRLKNNTQNYAALTTNFHMLEQKLNNLEEDVKEIIETAEIAAALVGALSRLIALAAQVAL